MTTTIIHISDTHFGDDNPAYNRRDIKKALIHEINKLNGEKILVISGDITYKALESGYKEAKLFFEDIIRDCNVSRKNIIACPGNHDITPGNDPFESFDKFIYSLRRDHEISFNNNNNNALTLAIDETIFAIINTAAHLDHKYGFVSKDSLELLINSGEYINQFKNKIAVVHHHLIGTDQADTSTTRNSYSMLHALDKLQFNYVLHGHQHSKFDLPVGKSRIRISSARSLSYHGKGYSNGISTLDIESGTITALVWSPDEVPGQLTARVFR